MGGSKDGAFSVRSHASHATLRFSPKKHTMRVMPVGYRKKTPVTFLRQQRESLVLVTILLIIWELSVRLLNVAPYILPRPSSVALRIFESADLLATNAGVTLLEAFIGLLMAILLGVTTAIVFQLHPRIDKAGQPIVAGFQSFPKEAIAPLLVVWFGFGMTSKFIMACSIAFFPVFLSTLKGLKSVPDDIIHTFSSLRASPHDILLKARIPYSLPFVFSGIRVASTLSLVGAVIAEFLGSSSGLGHLILVANSQFSVDLVFASLFVLALLGITADTIIQQIERRVIPWHESVTGLAGI